MIISDLSYLENTSASNIEGSSNSAYVSQYASSAAGNNYGSYNYSFGNYATSLNISNIYQDDSDYHGYPYYYYY